MRLVLTCVIAACGAGASPPAPQLERAIPEYGPLVGGTRIVLRGTGFLADAAAPNRALVAGREAPLTRTLDDTTLEIVIPPGDQPGDAEILVLNQHGNASATGVFRYSTPPTISAIEPAEVVFSSTTLVTVTGTGFQAEGAGEVHVLVDGRLATDVQVTSDTTLTFASVPGTALVRPTIEIVDGRGSARKRGFRYAPSARSGLLLFQSFTSVFAVFFDPVDNSVVVIPRVDTNGLRLTAVVRDDQGDYWGIDRSQRFGRIDMRTQTLESPIQTSLVLPTMVRTGGDHLALERISRRFGRFDPATGAFVAIGTTPLPCCGSYGLASDGTTLYLTARDGAGVSVHPVDRVTGELGTAVPILASPGFHVEEMRFFEGTLYAASRDGTLVTIDPTTGATTALPWNLGRANAMELYLAP